MNSETINDKSQSWLKTKESTRFTNSLKLLRELHLFYKEVCSFFSIHN